MIYKKTDSWIKYNKNSYPANNRFIFVIAKPERPTGFLGEREDRELHVYKFLYLKNKEETIKVYKNFCPIQNIYYFGSEFIYMTHYRILSKLEAKYRKLDILYWRYKEDSEYEFPEIPQAIKIAYKLKTEHIL